MSSTIVFYGQFTTSGSGATGLTVTVDVTRITRSDGTRTTHTTAGSGVEITAPNARGVYLFRVTDADLTLYDYIAVFITAGTADLLHVPAVWARFSEGDTAVIAAIKLITDLLTAVYAEPTGAPAANESPLDKLAYLFAALRNKLTVTGSAKTFFDDAGASLWSKALADNGTTFTESEGA